MHERRVRSSNMADKKKKSANAYSRIIERIFKQHYTRGRTAIPFDREEIVEAAENLGLSRPKNLGDVIYSFRYRRRLPKAILDTQPPKKEWVIRGRGSASYQFVLLPITSIEPRPDLVETKVPDATPEIVAMYSMSDEQALLAKLRYNRLLDIFTGIATYSLQNHLRTTVGGQQIETDELYVGIGKTGAQYILPVQAKGGSDRLGRVQLEQDIALCGARFPDLVCRPIAAQFTGDDVIALFELTVVRDVVKVVEERHYKLVPASEISEEDLRLMRRAAEP